MWQIFCCYLKTTANPNSGLNLELFIWYQDEQLYFVSECLYMSFFLFKKKKKGMLC